jgi:hypothetical protein
MIGEQRMPSTDAIAQSAIAFLIFCHGFVYVRIGSMLPAPVKGWRGSFDSLEPIVSCCSIQCGMVQGRRC